MAVPTKNPPSSSSSVVHPPARTKSEREGLSPDPFQEVSSKVVDKVLAWRVPIAIGIIGVFAAAAGTSIWANYQSRQNAHAAEEMAKATASVGDNGDTLGQLGINLEDVARSPEELKERNDKLMAAAASLEKVATEFSGTASGIVAELERASLLAKAGKNDEAAAAYKTFLGKNLQEPVFKFRALSGLGNILRNEENYPEAEKAFEQISKEMEGIYKQHGLAELGRTYELAKDYTNATRTLEDYLKQFPDAPDAAEVGARLAVDKAGGAPSPAAAPAPAIDAAPQPSEGGLAPAGTAPAPVGSPSETASEKGDK